MLGEGRTLEAIVERVHDDEERQRKCGEQHVVRDIEPARGGARIVRSRDVSDAGCAERFDHRLSKEGFMF